MTITADNSETNSALVMEGDTVRCAYLFVIPCLHLQHIKPVFSTQTLVPDLDALVLLFVELAPVRAELRHPAGPTHQRVLGLQQERPHRHQPLLRPPDTGGECHGVIVC